VELADLAQGARVSWREIPGWCAFEQDYEHAIARALIEKPSIFVEVGCAFGRSLMMLAEKAAASGKPIRIVGVDPFLEIMGQEQAAMKWIGAKYKSAREAFEALTAEHAPAERARVKIMQLPSLEAAQCFPDASLECVWIDANHHYEHVKADLEAWLPKVTPGGTLGGDDFSLNLFPGVCAAVTEVLGPKRIFHVRGVSWWTYL
jgi:cephalosporin hydroxylase